MSAEAGGADDHGIAGEEGSVLPALQRLGGLGGGGLARQARDSGAVQLAYERELSRLRSRARADGREARARERQLRKLLAQRTEQLDILKVDLTTVVQRLEESEEHGRALHGALQAHRLEAARLREALAERERRLAPLESVQRSTAVQLATAQSELTTALEACAAARSDADEARASAAELREARRRAILLRALRSAARQRTARAVGLWSRRARLIAHGEEADASRRRCEQVGGLVRVAVSRTVGVRVGSELSRALLHWQRLSRGSSRALAVTLEGAPLLSLLLAHWRLLTQAAQLDSHLLALEAQRQNLTSTRTGAWWAAAEEEVGE